MATAKIKNLKKSTLRRLTAKNFLSNISLDGKYQESNTFYSLWKKTRRKSEPNLILSGVDQTLISSGNDIIPDTGNVTNVVEKTSENNVEASPSRPRASTVHKIRETPCDDVNEGSPFLERQQSNTNSSKRWRYVLI